ncbi:MAG: sodium:proton antiporter [Deltaproteobacteria bacterium]|nr:sodium:proton antiporter [Deltaproteobacteria bacterium]
MNLELPTLTVALAMLAGVIAQAVARHLRVPGIVILLMLGIGLGPDGANVLRPSALGAGLPAFVGFAVSIILFEGALSVRFGRLRQQALSIRRLVTRGALVTAVLSAAAVIVFLRWEWRLAVVFGTLVVVTGPTVINPLVRRLRLQPHLGEILVAEGIFGDAIGATCAVAALELVVAHSGRAIAGGALTIVLRFGTGALVGGVAGLFLVGVLRIRRLIPAGLENVLAVAIAVASFQVGNAIVSESGLTAAIVAGLLVGTIPTRGLGHIAEFEEQLTDLLVATLFVLLSASVRISDVQALGVPGLLVVGTMMFVVRPLAVLVSTHKSELTMREKLLLAWIGPRGIVAAAVSSLFASELADHGISGGVEFRALVFALIAATVTVQGLSAGLVARALGVRLPARKGVLLLGANALARLLARALVAGGERVTLIETREDLCQLASNEGLPVVNGDGLSPPSLIEAGVDNVRMCLAMTPNEHVNFLFARLVAEELRGPELAVMLERRHHGVTAEMAEQHDFDVLFAGESAIGYWLAQVEAESCALTRWQLEGSGRERPFASLPHEQLLPLVLTRGKELQPVTTRTQPRKGDTLTVAIATRHHDAAALWLRMRGWRPIEEAPSRALVKAT